MACWQAMAFRLPATAMGKRWLVDCHSALPGHVLGWKDYLTLKDIARSLRITKRYNVRKTVVLAMALQRCAAIQSGNTPRGPLQSSTRALQMPHPPTWEGRCTRSQHVGHGEEGSHDSCHLKKGSCHWDLRVEAPITVPVPNELPALEPRGGCSIWRIGPYAEEKTTSTSWVYPFLGDGSSNPCPP